MLSIVLNWHPSASVLLLDLTGIPNFEQATPSHVQKPRIMLSFMAWPTLKYTKYGDLICQQHRRLETTLERREEDGLSVAYTFQIANPTLYRV